MGLGVWGRKTAGVKCRSHHIISRVHAINVIITVDLNLDHQAEVVTVSLVHHKVTLPPFSMLSSLDTMDGPHLGGGELCFPSLRAEYLHKLFGILLHWRFVCSPPFIYFFNHFLGTIFTVPRIKTLPPPNLPGWKHIIDLPHAWNWGSLYCPGDQRDSGPSSGHQGPPDHS